jgi:hypothetical protein
VAFYINKLTLDLVIFTQRREDKRREEMRREERRKEER